MPLACLELDHDVIDIDLYGLRDEGLEHSTHETLVCRPCVLNTKQHDFIEKICHIRHEHCFVLVPLMHLDLVIPRISIKETKKLVLDHPVY